MSWRAWSCRYLSLLAAPLALALVEFATSQLASVQGPHGPLLHMEDIDRTALPFITGTTLLTCLLFGLGPSIAAFKFWSEAFYVFLALIWVSVPNMSRH
jgi:hypothetical protein